MSKLNGDKARHNRQQYQKALLRQRRRKLGMRLAAAKTLSKADK